MENVTEALKIAFAVLMFVLALTLSISSFSQASSAVNAIITLRDRESEYTYVQPAGNLSRIVGIETVVSSLYRIPEQNLEVHFYQKQGTNEVPIGIFNLLNVDGSDTGNDSNYMDLAHDNLTFGENFKQNEFLDVLIGGNTLSNWTSIKDKYVARLIKGELDEGLYEKFKDAEFEERLGEYVQGSGASEITKRVITYVKQ